MKKRLFALGLCAALALTLCGCNNDTESAPETEISAPQGGGGDRVNPVEESKPTWEYDEQYDGSLWLTEYNGGDFSLKIPEEIDGAPVSGLGYGFGVGEKTTTVEIPACVTHISTQIDGASLTEFVVDEANEYYYSQDGVLYKKEEYSGDNILHSCPPAKKGEMTVPSDVAGIGEYAFADCTGLTSVVLPEGLTEIGAGAFTRCTALVDVNIPKSVETIDGYAFKGCTKLETLDIPESVTEIGQHPFDGTPFLAALQVKDPLVIINNILVDGTAATGEVTVPDGVKEIVYEAFDPEDGGNETITKITLPDSVERIGGKAFSYCAALTEVRLPAGVKEIGNEFTGCGFTEFTVPDGVEKIGSFFLNNCENLTKVTLPDSIVEIDSFDFLDGSEKAVVVYKGKTYAQADFETLFEDVEKNTLSNLPEWEYTEQNDGSLTVTAYNGTSENVKIPAEIDGKPVTALSLKKVSPTQGVKTVEIPASVELIWSRKFGETITELTVAEDNPYYRSKDGMVFIKENDSLIAVPQGRSGAVTVPEGTKEIGAFAFSECENVTGVTLPEGVTYISDSAFAGCIELSSVNIPSTVTEMGDYAFYGCEKLETLQIPETVTSFGEMCFDNTPFMEKLREKNAEKNALVVINGVLVDGNYAKGAAVIPDNVTKIAPSAFVRGYSGNSEITSVTVPDSVTEIGESAFSRCDKLAEVKLPGGLKEISDRMFYLCPALKKIEIPGGIEEIGMYAFEGCKSLESVTVPDSVKHAWYGCFEDCPKLKLTYKGKTYTAENIEDFYSAENNE